MIPSRHAGRRCSKIKRFSAMEDVKIFSGEFSPRGTRAGIDAVRKKHVFILLDKGIQPVQGYSN